MGAPHNRAAAKANGPGFQTNEARGKCKSPVEWSAAKPVVKTATSLAEVEAIELMEPIGGDGESNLRITQQVAAHDICMRFYGGQ